MSIAFYIPAAFSAGVLLTLAWTRKARREACRKAYDVAFARGCAKGRECGDREGFKRAASLFVCASAPRIVRDGVEEAGVS